MKPDAAHDGIVGTGVAWMENALIRAADIFFTAVLLLAAGLGVLVAAATGHMREVSFAMLLVALAAPWAYRRFSGA